MFNNGKAQSPIHRPFSSQLCWFTGSCTSFFSGEPKKTASWWFNISQIGSFPQKIGGRNLKSTGNHQLDSVATSTSSQAERTMLINWEVPKDCRDCRGFRSQISPWSSCIDWRDLSSFIAVFLSNYYCWWFRNPIPNHLDLRCIKPCK